MRRSLLVLAVLLLCGASAEAQRSRARRIRARPPLGTMLFTESFEDTNWTNRGWYDSPNGVVTTSEFIEGSHALQVHWGIGTTTAPGPRRHLFTDTDRVYLSYQVKYSANFQGSAENFHPHMFMFLTNEEADGFSGLAQTHLTTYVENVFTSASAGYPVLLWQDGTNINWNGNTHAAPGPNLIGVTEDRAIAGCNGNQDGVTGVIGQGVQCYILFDPDGWSNAKGLDNGALLNNTTKQSWHRIEAYFQLNSVGATTTNADGIARMWLDGTIQIDRSNLVFRTSFRPNMKFNQIDLIPFIGDGSAIAQDMYIDDMKVATGRVS